MEYDPQWIEATGVRWDAVQDHLYAAGLTDGLPVVPPTRTRVAAMLDTCGRAGDEAIGCLPPLFADVTWEQAAFNAVMAGCPPAALPVVVAAIDAMADPAFNLLGVATTTGAAAPLIVVNGPIVETLAMNSGGNALGPGNRANAAIGRAVQFILRNAAGARTGEVDMATLGQPGKYTFCFAENADASPWAPLHVERGFDAAQSVVTVLGVAGNVEIVDADSREGPDLIASFAQSMLIAGSASSHGCLGSGSPLLVMPPEHAQAFVEAGYDKTRVKEEIFATARLDPARLSSAVRERLFGTGAPAALPVAMGADDIVIVVAGGVGRKAAYVPGWNGGTRAISRAVPSA